MYDYLRGTRYTFSVQMLNYIPMLFIVQDINDFMFLSQKCTVKISLVSLQIFFESTKCTFLLFTNRYHTVDQLK